MRIFYPTDDMITINTMRGAHYIETSSRDDTVNLMYNSAMGERLEFGNAPEQRDADAIISLVEDELNDGPLHSKEHRDNLVRLLENTLLRTSDTKTRAKLIELLGDIDERYPDD